MACYVTKNISSTGPSTFSNVTKTGLFLKGLKDKKIKQSCTVTHNWPNSRRRHPGRGSGKFAIIFNKDDNDKDGDSNALMDCAEMLQTYVSKLITNLK